MANGHSARHSASSIQSDEILPAAWDIVKRPESHILPARSSSRSSNGERSVLSTSDDHEANENCSPLNQPHCNISKSTFRKDDALPSQDSNVNFQMYRSPGSSSVGSRNSEGDPSVSAPHVIVQASSTQQSRSTNSTPLRHGDRQDSGYEEVGSAIDVDLQARNIRARERVAILRGRVWRTRRILNDSRKDVQLLRARLQDETAKLIGAFDKYIATDDVRILQVILPLHQATRTAQDALGPAEDTLDMLEMRLNHEENELEQEEEHFYTRNNIILQAPPEDKLDEPLSPLQKPYEPDLDQLENLDFDNELVKRYLGRKGEAEHLKEEIDELENQQYKLTRDLQFRTRYNIQLSEESSSFLFDFPQIHKESVEKLKLLEKDLFDIRYQCIDEGLFREDEYVYDPRDALVEEVMDSVNEALERSPLRTAGQHARSYSSHEKDFSDKRDYVNTWLLEWVQDSVVESQRLKKWIYSEYPESGKGLAGDEWSELALRFWDNDTAGERANQFVELDTRDALSGYLSGGSDSSLGPNLDDCFQHFDDFSGTSDVESQLTQRGAELEDIGGI